MDENGARTEARKEPEPTVPGYSCHTCGDLGEVSMVTEGLLGKKLIAMPCPDCIDDPESKGRLRVESLRDKRLQDQDEKIRTVALVSLGTLIVVVLILFSIRDKLQPSAFAEAAKEVTEQ